MSEQPEKTFAYRLGWTEETLRQVLYATTSLTYRESRQVSEDVGNGERIKYAVRRYAEDPETVIDELKTY